MSRVKALRGQPMYVKTLWWTLTGLLVTWSLPWVGLALINPFWFRQRFFDLIEDHVNYLAKKRDKLLEPLTKKYQLFDTIKGSRAEENLEF